MERKKSDNEFEAVMGNDGTIVVPHGLAKRFVGKKLHVRLRSEEVASELMEKNVTEEEIERIANIQLESREQVVKFLLTEGSLRTSSLLRRVKGMHR